MKRPWQIWMLFALCLAVVIPAMAWLTVKTVQMDEQTAQNHLDTEIARREAQLQERVSSALWQMEWILTPHIAKEASRPYYVYQTFYQPPATRRLDNVKDQRASEIASPLLNQSTNFFVKLHFQVEPGNSFLCPTCPDDSQVRKAMDCGLDAERFAKNCETFTDVKQFFDYDRIIMSCSPEPASAVAINPDAREPSADSGANLLSDNYAGNIYENNNPELQQQLAGNYQSDSGDETDPQTPNQIQIIPQQSIGNNRAAQQREWNNTRSGQSLQARDRAAKSYLENELQTNATSWLNAENTDADLVVREGVMRPMWIDGKLILARQVNLGSKRVIQCCWLDWDKIKQLLLEEISETLPKAQLEPIIADTQFPVGRALATLPIQIVAGLDNLPVAAIQPVPNGLQPGMFSGIRLSLILAWVGLLLGAAAVGLLLHGVVKLSERRGTFVSAVTHELRTPLTTFRMYAEMLAEKMLPSDQKRQEYANTLRVEADRLAHLVENVLQFARLERGSGGGHKESLKIESLVERFEQRFKDRASESGMSLKIELDKSAASASIQTSAAAVEHVLFNLVDNACKYARDAEDKRIQLTCSVNNGKCEFVVRDFGPGLDRKQAKQLFQPFRKSDQDAANSAAGVGLGLALCKKLSRDLKGELLADTTEEIGARFVLRIPAN